MAGIGYGKYGQGIPSPSGYGGVQQGVPSPSGYGGVRPPRSQDRLFTSILGPRSVLNTNKGTGPIGNGYIHPLSGPSQAAYQIRPGVLTPRVDGSFLDLINVSYEPFVLILAAGGAVLSFLLYQVILTKGRRKGFRRATGVTSNLEDIAQGVVKGGFKNSPITVEDKTIRFVGLEDFEDKFTDDENESWISSMFYKL